jgi:hypothetical protein
MRMLALEAWLLLFLAPNWSLLISGLWPIL